MCREGMQVLLSTRTLGCLSCAAAAALPCKCKAKSLSFATLSKGQAAISREMIQGNFNLILKASHFHH